MLMQVSETGQGLALGYPPWLGLLVLGLGIALGIYLARIEWITKKHAGPAVAAVLAICAGVYWLTYRVTLTADGARAYVFLYRDDRVDWRHVESVAMEQRIRRGTKTFLVIRTAAGAELEINVTGLSGVDEHRVREFIAARVPAR